MTINNQPDKTYHYRPGQNDDWEVYSIQQDHDPNAINEEWKAFVETEHLAIRFVEAISPPLDEEKPGVIVFFKNAETADKHRSKYGGRIFAASNGDVIWFDDTFTPTAILRHRVLHGLNGGFV